MHIVDDICYAGRKSVGKKIIEVIPQKDRVLVITFSDGEKRIYDTKKLHGSVFDALDDNKVFENVELFHGILTWNNGAIDVAPETVYEDSEPYSQTDEYEVKSVHNPCVAEQIQKYN